jgi:hypothetical protein
MTNRTVILVVVGLLLLCGVIALIDVVGQSDCTSRGGHVRPDIVSRIGWFCEGATR